MKKYIELKPNAAATHIKIEVYYNLGGYNVFSYRNEPRGYYLSVTPVTRENCGSYTTETVTAFSGVKQLIKEVSRKSAKAEASAEKIAEGYTPALIAYICDKNGLELENPADGEKPVKYFSEGVTA